MLPNIKKNPSKENRDITIDVGGTSYILKIFFVNKDGLFRVQKNSFKQLEFRDNIYNPFLSISLVLLNNKNELESNLVTTPKTGIESLQYEFKGNSDEFVLITLKPEIESAGSITKKDKFEYKLELSCFIKDEEEFVEGENTYKIFELMDVKYRELTYPTKEWSTNKTLLKNKNIKPITQLSDNERSVHTGLALQDVIETFVSDKVINKERWDRGSTKLFYTSPIGTTPMQIMDYIIDNHASEKGNNLCLLREDKFGKLNFLSVEDIFNGISNKRFFMQGPEVVGSYELPIDTDNISGSSIAKPAYKDISPFVSNFPIRKYNYLNFAATSSLERLRSTNVINYDFKNKKYSFLKKEGDIERCIKYFDDNFLNSVPSKKAKVAFEPGENVLNRNLFTTLYSTSQDINSTRYEGRNEVIKNLLYLSNNIEIEANGNLNLRSGKFVNVVRKTGIDSKFERKIQGYYFILDTQHIINNKEYISNIIATKPYSV
tara:strand:- start:3274 stop:4740 length:1467 start_codon:yes stop_codon:yes gene_type:complete